MKEYIHIITSTNIHGFNLKTRAKTYLRCKLIVYQYKQLKKEKGFNLLNLNPIIPFNLLVSKTEILH